MSPNESNEGAPACVPSLSPSMTWAPVKRPSGTCYDVVSGNGIRCTPWPITKLCHAKVRADLMQGTPDDAGDLAPEHKLAILRVMAHNKAFERFEASDRSRNYPEAVAAWNAYVPTVQIVERDGQLSCIGVHERFEGWQTLPGILATIAKDGAS